MPILKNPKHELFAQEIAKGHSATEAYVLAGYSHNEGNAGRLNRNEQVSNRVKEILTVAADKCGVTIERVMAELAKIGFSNMADYMRVGPDGDPVLDFSALSRDQAAALVECTVEDFKDGRGEDVRDVRRVKFRLADKRAALVDLGKHLGMFRDRVELTGKDGGPVEMSDISPIEAARRIAFALAKGQRAKPDKVEND